MIEINAWINNFLNKLTETFENRVWFVGLQGSYGRGEATINSDIDIVVILNELNVSDIQVYNDMLDTLPHRKLICGFISGKNEILNWEPSDLFQFYYDTTPIYGSLGDLLLVINDASVDKAIKSGVCNIYHACVHNILHKKSEDIIRNLYKSASFVVQAIVFKQTKNYFKHQTELIQFAKPKERVIIEYFLKYKNGESVDFNQASQNLFMWAKEWIADKL